MSHYVDVQVQCDQQADLARRHPEWFYQPVKGNEWEQWKARMWNTLVDQFGYPGFTALEQYMRRSKREQRCIECGAPGTVKHTSYIVAAVPHYWMCQSCHDYWETKD